MFGLAAYNAEPSEGEATRSVPASTLAAVGDAYTAKKLRVMVFLHPRCPCSRATIIELARTLRMSHTAADIKAIFFKPATEPDSWVQHNTWDLCGEMRGIQRIIDNDGQIARQYGINASGHILVYSYKGDLLFGGGITESRGHEGDNPARRAFGLVIESNGDKHGGLMPVFGCSLFSECKE